MCAHHTNSLLALTATVTLLLCDTALARPWKGSASAGPYSVEVRSSWGGRLPTFRHAGQTYVMGNLGQRYEIVVHNRSGRRVEAVISVDGLDAIDGKRGDFRKRGYIIEARDKLKVDGFRVSLRDVAAFRFSRAHRSYAARKGAPRHVGVIGVAIFPERYRRRHRPWRYRRAPHHHHEGHPHQDGVASEGSGGAASRPSPEARARSSSGRGRYSFEPKRKRPRSSGIGTGFGERRYSPVSETAFTRANKHWPASQLTVRYNDRRGLRKLGIDVDRHRPRWRRELRDRETATPFRQSAPRRFATPPRGW